MFYISVIRKISLWLSIAHHIREENHISPQAEKIITMGHHIVGRYYLSTIQFQTESLQFDPHHDLSITYQQIQSRQLTLDYLFANELHNVHGTKM